MKFIITFVLFVVVAVSALPHNKIRPIMPRPITSYSRIVGGSPATLGQFPYQTRLYFEKLQKAYTCGGSLIGANWVLTAAHCSTNVTRFIIDLGTIDLQTPNVQISASKAILHPDYTGTSASNDIALIRLDGSVHFNEYIQPVRLNGAFIGAGQSAIASGWGATSDTSGGSRFLNWVELQTITNAECNSVYGGVIDGMICCKGADTNKGTCAGDSGGPLVVGEGANAIHIGVVSFGAGVGCERNFPSGFSRTSFYRNWIKEVTGI